MNKYYFTFGSDEHQPYYGGWIEVIAASEHLAIDAFKFFYPNPRNIDLINCAGIYAEKTFKKSQMYKKGNLGAYCHGTIKAKYDFVRESSR